MLTPPPIYNRCHESSRTYYQKSTDQTKKDRGAEPLYRVPFICPGADELDQGRLKFSRAASSRVCERAGHVANQGRDGEDDGTSPAHKTVGGVESQPEPSVQKASTVS